DRGDQAGGRTGVIVVAEHVRGPVERVDLELEVVLGIGTAFFSLSGPGDDDRVDLPLGALVGAVDGEDEGLNVVAVVLVDVLDLPVCDLWQQGDLHAVQGGQERGVGNVRHGVGVGGRKREGHLLGVSEVPGDLGLFTDLARSRRLVLFLVVIVGAFGRVGVCATAVGRHHSRPAATR